MDGMGAGVVAICGGKESGVARAGFFFSWNSERRRVEGC
jgi:hypothetical protein